MADFLTVTDTGYITTHLGNTRSFSKQTVPRLIIGGTHFWGHADFYVSFVLSSIGVNVDNHEASYYPGIETGFKYYHCRLSHNAIRPYVGVSWVNFSYQKDLNALQGPLITRHTFPLLLGFTYSTSFGLFDLGAQIYRSRDV